MTGFDLRALVRDVCATSTIADPGMLAKEVNRRIKKVDRDAALEQALRSFVHQVVSLNRNSPTSHVRVDTHLPRAGGGSTSHKVAGIRNAWRRMLRDRVSVGPAPSDWKFLEQCTAPDLDYVASIREKLAQQNATAAATYRELQQLVTEHNVSTVGDLPESVLEPVLGDAA